VEVHVWGSGAVRVGCAVGVEKTGLELEFVFLENCWKKKQQNCFL
jgi:hypothetical protein